ncbi:MAG: hypothetical protein IT184_10255 [Acidobacteria bacterium]|nr:hypothetical protein [Acidobacteriota bacterium]
MSRICGVFGLAFVVMAYAAGCGKKTPTQPAAQQTTPSGGQSFVGSVAMSGGTGVVVINSTRRVAAAGVGPLEWLAGLLEPRLLAQSGSADGVLLLPDGTSVSLSGTVAGNTFTLSGDGGYSVTATASGGTISGTVTTPGGVAPVSPMR